MNQHPDFTIVTERGGEPVSKMQLDRFHQRYIWAGSYCKGRDVLEMACGTGPGLGYLWRQSQSLMAGDVSSSVLALARAHYGDRIDLREFDAARTPFADTSVDVIILFEAIYYLSDLDAFAREVRRLLRPRGVLLLATANKDLLDFNPSPFSKTYLNPPELRAWLGRHGFACSFLGGSPVAKSGVRARVLRTIKRFAVSFHLIPESMRGKRLLKRFVFGRLVTMPVELSVEDAMFVAPVSIDPDSPDTTHQVIYCVAEKIEP
jgi:SAM-dependent methyltransferase